MAKGRLLLPEELPKILGRWSLIMCCPYNKHCEIKMECCVGSVEIEVK